MEWAERGVPILKAIYAAEEAEADTIMPSTVRPDHIGESAFQRSLLRLIDGGFVNAPVAEVAEGPRIVTRIIGLTPAGLSAIGEWPSAEVAWDRLVAALEARAAEEPEGPAKRRLLDAVKAVAGLGRDLGIEVTGAVINQQFVL